jgi:hypothetical protein
MEPSHDRLTELAARVALLSAQRPTGAAQCEPMPTLSANGLYPKRVKVEADG